MNKLKTILGKLKSILKKFNPKLAYNHMKWQWSVGWKKRSIFTGFCLFWSMIMVPLAIIASLIVVNIIPLLLNLFFGFHIAFMNVHQIDSDKKLYELEQINKDADALMAVIDSGKIDSELALLELEDLRERFNEVEK